MWTLHNASAARGTRRQSSVNEPDLLTFKLSTTKTDKTGYARLRFSRSCVFGKNHRFDIPLREQIQETERAAFKRVFFVLAFRIKRECFIKDVISAFEAKAAFVTTAFFRSIRLCICTFFL